MDSFLSSLLLSQYIVSVFPNMLEALLRFMSTSSAPKTLRNWTDPHTSGVLSSQENEKARLSNL